MRSSMPQPQPLGFLVVAQLWMEMMVARNSDAAMTNFAAVSAVRRIP